MSLQETFLFSRRGIQANIFIAGKKFINTMITISEMEQFPLHFIGLGVIHNLHPVAIRVRASLLPKRAVEARGLASGHIRPLLFQVSDERRRDVINYVEHSEPTASRDPATHEVQRWLGSTGTGAAHGHRPRAYAPFATHCQPHCRGITLRLLQIDHKPVTPQPDMQVAIAEPAALVRQIEQLLPQHAVVSRARAVTDDCPVRCNHPARPPLADIK